MPLWGAGRAQRLRDVVLSMAQVRVPSPRDLTPSRREVYTQSMFKRSKRTEKDGVYVVRTPQGTVRVTLMPQGGHKITKEITR